MTKQEALLILQALPDDTEVTIILGKYTNQNTWPYPVLPNIQYWQDPYKITCNN